MYTYIFISIMYFSFFNLSSIYLSIWLSSVCCESEFTESKYIHRGKIKPLQFFISPKNVLNTLVMELVSDLASTY